MMPEMDGWQFRAEQLRDAALREIPVVVMTASRGFDGAALRAAEILHKPVGSPSSSRRWSGTRSARRLAGPVADPGLTELALLTAVALAAGIVDAIAGGGGLLTVPALLAAGLPPHLALGTNKGQSVFGSFAALVRFSRAGLVDPARAS